MIELRPDQRLTVEKGKAILHRYNLLYLAAQVRTGKTLMSMTIAKELGFRRILFITKKMAISSIKSDYATKLGHLFQTFEVTNFEQVPKLFPQYDLIIIDEATSISKFPKPGVYCKAIKKLAGKTPVILMSGTPTAESYSQIFHQFWVSYYSPFVYTNFYAWAKDYVNVKKKFFKGLQFADYSDANEAKIKEVLQHYMVTLSQEEAGFKSAVDEEIVWVDTDEKMYKLMGILKRDKVYTMKNGQHIVADTPVKMQSLFHQISSGTVITEEGHRHILDETKALFVKQKFAGKKIAIFYKFQAEGDLLRKIFPLHTDVTELFRDRDDVTFICQIMSGRMGVNLATAYALIMYNIDFSATSYWQARARMQEHARTIASKLFWFFSKNGLEQHVYKAVCNKKDFTLSHFRKTYGL